MPVCFTFKTTQKSKVTSPKSPLDRAFNPALEMQHNSTYPIANQNTSNPGLLRMIPAHYSSKPFQITESSPKSLVII